MVPYLLAAIGGALLMGRTKPATAMQKRECIGPRTGNIYIVEEVEGLGTLIVHGPAGSMGQFDRTAEGTFKFVRGIGHIDALRAMQKDLEP